MKSVKTLLGNETKVKQVRVKLLVSISVIILGIGLIAYPKFTDWQYTRLQRGQKDFLVDQAKKTKQKVASVSNSQSLSRGVIAKLFIPKIGVETLVFQGTTPGVLKKGVGHYEETSLPGERGNSAIAGHRTMYGHPFRHLDKLGFGDKIVVVTKDGRHNYRVARLKKVLPTDLSVLDSSGKAELTLTTCNPVGSSRERLIVVAKLEGS
jgi:sortase A